MLNQRRCSLTCSKSVPPAMKSGRTNHQSSGLEGVLDVKKFLREGLWDLLQHIKNVCMKLFITTLYLLEYSGGRRMGRYP